MAEKQACLGARFSTKFRTFSVGVPYRPAIGSSQLKALFVNSCSGVLARPVGLFMNIPKLLMNIFMNAKSTRRSLAANVFRKGCP
jgi:hypothetical protein